MFHEHVHVLCAGQHLAQHRPPPAVLRGVDEHPRVYAFAYHTSTEAASNAFTMAREQIELRAASPRRSKSHQALKRRISGRSQKGRALYDRAQEHDGARCSTPAFESNSGES